MEKYIKMYQLVEGPMWSGDIPMWDDQEGWVVVGLIEQENGALMEEEVIFDTFDEAYQCVYWFKSQIAPFEIKDYV
jgi:hypothetical protein